jgi:hypothetical protein
MMIHTIKPLIKRLSCILLLLPTLSCGRWANAPEDSVEAPATPEYPELDGNVLKLTNGTAGVGYGGTMMVFNEGGKPGDIARVLQASIDSRLAWADARYFEVESDYNRLYADNGMIPTAIEDMKAQLRLFEAEARAANPIPHPEKKLNSALWFEGGEDAEGELDRLYGGERDAERSRAQTIWQYYCDAKVIELATNAYFAKREYLERPSPMGFCENYYTRAGYFTGESCQENPEGQSYFRCLWTEGVVKTYWFEEIYLNPESQKPVRTDTATVIPNLLSDENIETFRRILALDRETLVFPSAAFERFVFGASGELRDYFSKVIMKQTEAGRLCQRILPDLTEICDIFAIDRPKLAANAVWDPEAEMPLDPFGVISVLEQRETSLNDFFTFPPRTRSDSEVNTKAILSYFGGRNPSTHRNSESDRNLHLLASGESLPRPEFSDAVLENESEIQDILAAVIYGKLVGDELVQFNKKSSLIQQMETELNQARSTKDKLQARITATSNAGFTAANQGHPDDGDHVAHAFIEIRLKVTNHDGLVRAYFWVKEHEERVTLGCFNRRDNVMLEAAQCQPHKEDGVSAQTWYAAKEFSIDPDTGRLDFALTMAEPELMGFGYKARVSGDAIPDSFMDLTAEQTQGKVMAFELHPNRLKQHLEILTGKAFIRDEGQDLYEAGVSLWDQKL